MKGKQISGHKPCGYNIESRNYHGDENISLPEWSKKEQNKYENPLAVDLSIENLQRAFIYSEVFGEPLSKRRGRWRY